MKKRKILKWTGGGCLALILLLGVLAYLLFALPTARFRKFSRAHAGAAAQIEATLRPALGWPGPGQGNAPANEKGNPATKGATTAGIDLMQELHALGEGAMLYRRLMYTGSRPFYMSNLTLLLPAEDYPETRAAAPLANGEALRRKITEEAAIQESASLDLLAHVTNVTSSRALTTMTAAAQPLLDRTARLLERRDWDWPDLHRSNVDETRSVQYDYLAQAAVLRASVRGETERAGRLLEGALKITILGLLQDHLSPDTHTFNIYLEAMLLSLGRAGMPKVDGLDRAAEMLTRARLDEAQGRELRALQAMWLDRYCSEHKIPFAQLNTEGFPGKVAGALNTVVMAATAALLKPAARAWAEGDEAGYNAVTRRVGNITKITKPITRDDFQNMIYRSFPPENLFPNGGHPFNDRIDRLRLLLALARYRQAQGRDPGRIEDLVPLYLNRAFLEQSGAAWGIAHLPAGSYPARAPGIYHDARINDWNAFGTAVAKFREKYHRLPHSVGELAPLAAGQPEAARFAQFFQTLAGRTILYHVRRLRLSKDYIARVRYTSNDKQRFDELLARSQGSDSLDVLQVDALWPEPERDRPELLDLLKDKPAAEASRGDGETNQ